jgi:hypothetical protein
VPSRKLTDAQIIEMRTRRAAGESLKSLAKAFGLIPEYVSYVAGGNIHKNIGGPITKPYSVFTDARKMEVEGEMLLETKWAERAGLPLATVRTRRYRGWSEQDALSTPHRTSPSRILTPPGPSIAYVILNEGQFACIDVETIPLVQDYHWYVVKDPKYGRMYPATHPVVDGKGEFLSMRTLVLGDKPTTSYALNWNNLDCRKANLRDVSKAQSSWRNAKRSNNKTGYTGVSWNEQKKRFIARLTTNGVAERVGSFKTLEEAAAALDQAAIRIRGDFARLQIKDAPGSDVNSKKR